MELLRVVQRPPEYELMLWDGSDEAADWVTGQFGDAATISGESGDRTLHMWGTWEIPRGSYVANQWGSFNFVPVDQVATYQLAEPLIEVAQPEPEPEPATEPEAPVEPATESETPPAETPPAETPAEPEPVTEPAPDTPADGEPVT